MLLFGNPVDIKQTSKLQHYVNSFPLVSVDKCNPFQSTGVSLLWASLVSQEIQQIVPKEDGIPTPSIVV